MIFYLDRLTPYLGVLKKICDLKKNSGIYVVGGAVRDLWLNKDILDLDFALQGSGIQFAQEAARKLKGAFIPLSEKDDEARVVLNKELVLDFKGFNATIEDDLALRDFTINAIAIPLGKIIEKKDVEPIDPFRGIDDLNASLIRAVGTESIKNDPLRILRAYRFSGQLGFKIDPWLEREAERTSLENVARERVSYELKLIFQSTTAYSLANRLVISGLMEQIFPFPLFWKDYDVRSHSLMVFLKLEQILNGNDFADPIKALITKINNEPGRRALLMLTAMFHDVSKPETCVTCEDGSIHFYGHDTRGAKKMFWALSKILRFSNTEAEYVEQAVARHMHLHLLATSQELTERAMRRFTRNCGPVAEDVMILDLADGYATAGRTRHLEKTIAEILDLAAKDAERSSFKPLVNGNDLIGMGLEPGPLFKVILADMEELQWERKISTKEEGVTLVREKLACGEYTLPEENSDDTRQ